MSRPDTPETEKLTVLWHLKKFPGSLGRGALLAAEAQAYAGCDALLDIAIINHERTISPALMDVMRNIEGVTSVTLYSSFQEIPYSENLWPSTKESEVIDYDFDTTVRLQKKFTLEGYRPRLRMNAQTKKTAQKLLKKIAANKPVLAVHLKNQQRAGTESNASIEVWQEFIHSRPETMFCLIGHDPVPQTIASLDNVRIMASLTSDLQIHLAMIAQTRGFLGMQSGPANFAILSDSPYVIFKNPGHHAEEMAKEIGNDTKYVFATPHQKVWREYETIDRLNNAVAVIMDARNGKPEMQHAS